MPVVFSDLHLRESSETICFRVLGEIEKLAMAHDKQVVFCGDFWHLRYQVNVRLLNCVAEWLHVWERKGLMVNFLPGNHDQVDVAGRNALEVFAAFSNVTVWTNPGGHTQGGTKIGWVPYRKDPAEIQQALKYHAQMRSAVVYAHFGVAGSIMNNGRADQEGVVVPKKVPPLILGHYHKRQVSADNAWQYVGSPYQTSFGEAGNECGCLLVDYRGDHVAVRFQPIDVGAPKHYILEWDPATQPAPPPWPGQPHDLVRLDIKASQEMIVQGKFKGVLKKAGLDAAQVNVVPVQVAREHRFSLQTGESLLAAAGRFAAERVEDQASRPVMMEALQRWAQ
jgi:DNA repair exonuclease SbcCD nuclease subunit